MASFVSAALVPRGIVIRARASPFQQTAFEYFGTPTRLSFATRSGFSKPPATSLLLRLEYPGYNDDDDDYDNGSSLSKLSV
ncbi:hypothetical protein SLS56_011728 [Neofusicoccum ribis]|uniref:Uncharacterized protein n=1 Tax=Neofusicoccum ribis TaxID=45134 RepID=A0ABR3SAS2_9PEZI